MHIIFFSILASIILSLNGCGNTNDTKSTNLTKLNPNLPEKTSHAIIINEILAVNKNSIQDPDFAKNVDYIELYNTETLTVDLSGYGLSDKEGVDIWRFPAGTKIPPKGFLLVWADKNNTKLHTSFKLNSSKDMVILYDTGTNVLDKIVFEKQYADIALGRDKDGKQIFLMPTPNQANNAENNIINPKTDFNPTTNLIISEFMASNRDYIVDPDYTEFSDWIELYNRDTQSINIGGYKISDKQDKEGWTIPFGTILPPKGFIIIWADKQARGIHTDFSLSSSGESLYLSNKTGEVIDKVEFGKQKLNISYGRDLESLTWGYMLPTFESINSKIYAKTRAVQAIFSQDGGFYDGTFSLVLSSENAGEIHYTTDGSTPNKKSNTFSAPINLTQTTVVKAISYEEGTLPSKVKTATFFINEESKLPIVSLSTNDDNLFDDTIGIYVKGTNGAFRDNSDSEKYNFEQNWFRPVHLSIYENKQKMYSKNAEFAISGATSRYWNKKKSFKFELNNVMDYKLYPGKNLTNIKNFKLRTGHNAFEIGDLLANQLVEDGNLNVEYQAYRTINMFMNGEFWGVYNIREKRGSDYITSNYPEIDEKNLDIIKVGSIRKGDRVEHDKMRKFITQNDLNITANYEKAIAMIDEKNFIDYLCVELFSANDDWVGSNNRIWKEKSDTTKWRWIIDDVDRGFHIINVDKNMFDYVATYPTNTLLQDMFNAFNKNSVFKSKFKKRFIELLNSTLSETNVMRIANNLLSQRKEYITKGRFATSVSKYDAYVNELTNFIHQRGDIVRAHLEGF